MFDDKEDINDLPALLTSTEFAALLKIGKATFYKHVQNGSLPEPIRISLRTLRYRKEDVLDFLKKKGK